MKNKHVEYLEKNSDIGWLCWVLFIMWGVLLGFSYYMGVFSE